MVLYFLEAFINLEYLIGLSGKQAFNVKSLESVFDGTDFFVQMMLYRKLYWL